MIGKPKTEGALTAKQQRFCNEYSKDCHAGNAALAAGYSPKTASRIGSENLEKPLIRAEIEKKSQKRAEKCEITAEYVLNNIKRVGEQCIANGKEQGALKAQELLGRYLRLFDMNTVVVEKHLHLTKIDINEINTGKQIQDFTRQLSQKS